MINYGAHYQTVENISIGKKKKANFGNFELSLPWLWEMK